MKTGLEVEKATVKEDMLMSSENKGERAGSKVAKGELRIVQTVVDAPRAQGHFHAEVGVF